MWRTFSFGFPVCVRRLGTAFALNYKDKTIPFWKPSLSRLRPFLSLDPPCRGLQNTKRVVCIECSLCTPPRPSRIVPCSGKTRWLINRNDGSKRYVVSGRHILLVSNVNTTSTCYCRYRGFGHPGTITSTRTCSALATDVVIAIHRILLSTTRNLVHW